VVPIFGKLNVAGNTLFDPVTFTDFPALLDDPTPHDIASMTITNKTKHFNKQAIIFANSDGDPNGTYAAGFCIMCNNVAGYNMTSFNIGLSVRQFSDQQTPNYRDPLR
jgi:hypothetical protein